MTITKEDAVYVVLVVLLAVSMVGLPVIRYSAYLLPFFAYAIWAFSKPLQIHPNRNVAPFILLIVLSLITIHQTDYNGFKKLYFVLTYTSVFLMFDLTKSSFSVTRLNIIFIGVLLVSTLIEHQGLPLRSVQFSVVDSQSSFESSLSFPLGLFALYFLLKRQYLWFVLNMLLSLLTLKRIVLMAFLLLIPLTFLPKRLRRAAVNPIVVTSGILVFVLFAIEFAAGSYDAVILEYLGRAPNDLSKGRQELWASAIGELRYTLEGFTLLGAGNGKVVTALQEVYGRERILLHSDFLTVALEYGLLSLVIVAYLFNAQRSVEERQFALFLSILFLTDNVLIYQHVMLTYLLLLAALRRGAVAESAVARPDVPDAPGATPADALGDKGPSQVLQLVRPGPSEGKSELKTLAAPKGERR